VALPDLEAVPADTLTTVVVGEDDVVVGDEAARVIWEGLRAVPLERRDFVTLRSDHRGLPPLRATHLQPQTGGWGGRVDALDWFGTWKLLDLLEGCAFRGEGCDAALGNTPEQRFMGVWSDGEPVTEATVTDFPLPPDGTRASPVGTALLSAGAAATAGRGPGPRAFLDDPTASWVGLAA
jgi:hypothetical protein